MDELFEKELDALEAPTKQHYRQEPEETFFIDTAMAAFALMVIATALVFGSTLFKFEEKPITVTVMLGLGLLVSGVVGWCIKNLQVYYHEFNKQNTQTFWSKIKVNYEQPKRRSHKVVRKKGVTLYG